MDIGYILFKLKSKIKKDGTVKTALAVGKKVGVTLISYYKKKQIQKFIASSVSSKSIFIIVPIDWKHPLKQRPHHFATELSNLGYKVIYLTPNNLYDKVVTVTKVKDRLFLAPFHKSILRYIKNSVVMFSSTDPFVDIDTLVTLKTNKNYIIYDYIDEISPEISGNIDFMLKRHNYIKQNPDTVDLVSAVSLKLYQEMASFFDKQKLIYLPNGCDFEHFSKVEREKTTPPLKIADILKQNKPIIGYYGAMATWIDYDLINFLAKSFPEFNIVLIGPDYDGSVKKLENLTNIHYIGPVDYDELPKYAVYFDLAIIPFKEGDVARSTSPIKMYEYFALGKVVLYTKDLVECNLYKTPIMIERDRIKDILPYALKLSKDKEYISQIKREAVENSWKSRVEKIQSVLETSFR